MPIALERARRHGIDVEAGKTWIIGDSPNDLACARAGGTQCLLVATGRPSYDELASLGADEVLHDLADVERVLALVRS